MDMRRPLALVALIAVVAVTTACQDRTTDGFAIVNDSDTDITVIIVDSTEVAVESGHREVVTMDDCLGTGVVVTAEGHPDIELEGSACVAAVLYVREDHSAYIEAMYG